MRKNYYPTMVMVLLVILTSGCKSKSAQNIEVTVIPTNTPIVITTQELIYNPCDLITIGEWEAYFGESPLYFKEVDGGCRVSNQWDTRSIFIGIYPETQSIPAIRWFTQGLSALSKNSEFLLSLQDVLNQTDLTARQFLDEQIKLYEMITFRSERVYVVGDYSMWLSYPESSTNILEVIDADRFLRVEAIGFYSVEAKGFMIELGKITLEQTPDDFSVRFVNNEPQAEQATSVIEPLKRPALDQFSAEPNQIRYGSLCGGEVAQIIVKISNTENINQVLFVYRLQSPNEKNLNWTTWFLSQTEPGIWSKTINAESDFNAYQLTSGAKLEAFIGVLYGVDQVINFDPEILLSVDPCSGGGTIQSTPKVSP